MKTINALVETGLDKWSDSRLWGTFWMNVVASWNDGVTTGKLYPKYFIFGNLPYIYKNFGFLELKRVEQSSFSLVINLDELEKMRETGDPLKFTVVKDTRGTPSYRHKDIEKFTLPELWYMRDHSKDYRIIKGKLWMHVRTDEKIVVSDLSKAVSNFYSKNRWKTISYWIEGAELLDKKIILGRLDTFSGMDEHLSESVKCIQELTKRSEVIHQLRGYSTGQIKENACKALEEKIRNEAPILLRDRELGHLAETYLKGVAV